MSNNDLDQSNDIPIFTIFPYHGRRQHRQDIMNIIFRTVIEEMDRGELEDGYESKITDMYIEEYEDHIEERNIEIAMRESLSSYKTQEKKPYVKLDIKSKLVTSDKKDENCSICMSGFEIDEKITDLECNHLFHTNCIAEWVMYKPECPCCRVLIKTKDTDI